MSDTEDLALGAVVLGTGGGGDPWMARLMLDAAIEKYGPVQMIDAADLDPESLVFSAAAAGSPSPRLERLLNGSESDTVVEAMEHSLGRKAAALIPIELGGFNSLFTLISAAQRGLPCIDADTMGRAFPKVDMTTLTLAGVSASPIMLTDVFGNLVQISTVNNSVGENVMRAALTQMGMTGIVSCYPMTAAQCAEHAIAGSVSRAVGIGRRVRAIQQAKSGAYDDFLNFCDATILFTGKVSDVIRRTQGGWAMGTVTLESLDGSGQTMRVEIQNENLIALLDGVPVAAVPDLISMLDTETGIPMTTEALTYGQRLHVIAMPADKRWHEPDGLALAGPRAFGYDIDYVPIRARQSSGGAA